MKGTWNFQKLQKSGDAFNLPAFGKNFRRLILKLCASADHTQQPRVDRRVELESTDWFPPTAFLGLTLSLLVASAKS